MTITCTFAQSGYIPLLKQGNQWNILRRGANPYLNYTEIFKIEKDTVINGKLCKKVVKSTDSSSTALYNFAYYMYEDTLTKKIYTLDNNFNQKLYFDFSVSAGDTLILYCPYHNLINCDTFYVTQTDTFNIGGIYRKRVSSIYKIGGLSIQAHDWYEGIGTLLGLHYGGYPPYVGELMKLLCFKNNNQLIFENTGSYNCYYTNVGIDETELLQFAIYPNPATDYIAIECNFESVGNNLRLQITDAMGKTVLEKELTAAKDQQIIVVKDFAKGNYICIIYNNGKPFQNTKFIKK
jgi:hypothetical protein